MPTRPHLPNSNGLAPIDFDPESATLVYGMSAAGKTQLRNIPIAPITLVYGMNGAGKTRLINARADLVVSGIGHASGVSFAHNSVSHACLIMHNDEEVRREVVDYFARLDLVLVLRYGQDGVIVPYAHPMHYPHRERPLTGSLALLLPVLVQASLAARLGGVLGIEHPGVGLNDEIIVKLAWHLIELVRKRTIKPCFLIETASDTFRLVMQSAVAIGVDADYMRYLWVERSKAGRCEVLAYHFDDRGRIGDGHPPQASKVNRDLVDQLEGIWRAASVASVPEEDAPATTSAPEGDAPAASSVQE